MNSKEIIKYFDAIDQETQITIQKGTYKPLEVIKKHIFYKTENKTLIILDKYNSNLHLINIGSIKDIKFNGKRFGTNTWWNKTKDLFLSEVEIKMSS